MKRRELVNSHDKQYSEMLENQRRYNLMRSNIMLNAQPKAGVTVRLKGRKPA